MWTAESGELPDSMDYVVRDYWRHEVVAGKAASSDKTIRVSVKLNPGFYDIEFPDARQRFGIVSLPAYSGGTDPFFCIDSALSWLVRDDATCLSLARVLRRSGIEMSRERFAWGQINPAQDRWLWDETRYERLRQGYASQGISVLDMCHDAPAWMGHVGKYPQDLVAASDAWKQICRRWKTTWGGLEIWNEPDIFFGADLPADQYAALVKTIAYAAAQADVQSPLIGGVTAHFNHAWLDAAAENDVLANVDAFSFHTYCRAPAMEGLAGKFRQWLAAHDQDAMPLWLTECGRPWPRGTDRPAAEPDRESALDVTMKAVEARCCGVGRYFAFVYPFYEERDNNFGMMGRRATPLRSMAAYAQLTSALGFFDYLGDLVCEDPSVQRARVFGNKSQTVVVLYTGRPNRDAAVQLGVPVARANGIDGRPLTLTDNGGVPIADGLTYAWVNRQDLADLLKTDTVAQKLAATARKQPAARVEPSPIVMRYAWNRDQCEAKSDGYWFRKETCDEVPLRLRVFNLAEEPANLTLRLTGVAGQRDQAPEEEPIRVPARGSCDHTWDVALAASFARDGRARLTWLASNSRNQTCSRLVVDLFGQASLERILDHHPQAVRLPVQELERWRANIAGHGRMRIVAADGGGWKMHASFAGQDRWVYPFFHLPESIDLSKVTGIVLRARCAKPGLVRVFLWEGDTGVGYLTSRTIIPADGRWHTATIRFTDFSPSGANAPDPNGRLDRDQVKRLSIGMNSNAAENELEVSDVYVMP